MFLLFLGLICSLARTQVGIPFEVEFRKTKLVMEKQMNLGSCPSLLPPEISLFSFAGKIQTWGYVWLVTDPALWKQSKKKSILVEKQKREREQATWRSWNLFRQLTLHLLLLRTQAAIQQQSSIIVEDQKTVTWLWWWSMKESRGIVGTEGNKFTSEYIEAKIFRGQGGGEDARLLKWMPLFKWNPWINVPILYLPAYFL